MELRVFGAGWLSGTVRSGLECPFEYVKVKRQTGQEWRITEGFKGFFTLYPRSTFMMMTYFIMMDEYRRHTNLFHNKLGQFFASGSASVVGWFIIWPFENLKNITQADTAGCGTNARERAQFILRTYGPTGFWRGFLPGSMSVFIRNGAAMIAMSHVHKLLTKWGLR